MFTPGFNGVRVTWSLVLYVCFVDRCLSFCTVFFWPLCFLFIFDIRIMITPLMSPKYKKTNNDQQNIHIKLKIE
jgi:hypothetical protein